MEDTLVTCPQCGCDEEEILMSICSVCGEEYCTMCESWENPEMCDSCENELLNGEE